MDSSKLNSDNNDNKVVLDVVAPIVPTLPVTNIRPEIGADEENIAVEIYKRNVELLDQRRRAEQLLYGVSESVIAIDRDYNITIFNHMAEKMFGGKSADVLGTNIEKYLLIKTPKGQIVPTSTFCFQTDEAKTIMYSMVLSTKVKQFYVNIKTSIIKQGKSPEECLVTLTDVTKERELDKTKDDFISVTSHELRTPMTIIKSYLWMLGSEKKGVLNDKQKEYLEKAQKGAERMLALINDTLNISRIEQGRIEFKMELCSLREAVEEIAGDFRIKGEEKQIYVKTQYVGVTGDNILSVYADRGKLREILTNFIGNSIKFTKVGGITICVEKTEESIIKTSIMDTGRGISADDIEKLFHKFGRLDNSYQTVAESSGTGLGLYIVKSLVEKMGGTIGVFSNGLDKGSTFWFTLSEKPLMLDFK